MVVSWSVALGGGDGRARVRCRSLAAWCCCLAGGVVPGARVVSEGGLLIVQDFPECRHNIVLACLQVTHPGSESFNCAGQLQGGRGGVSWAARGGLFGPTFGGGYCWYRARCGG